MIRSELKNRQGNGLQGLQPQNAMAFNLSANLVEASATLGTVHATRCQRPTWAPVPAPPKRTPRCGGGSRRTWSERSDCCRGPGSSWDLVSDREECMAKWKKWKTRYIPFKPGPRLFFFFIFFADPCEFLGQGWTRSCLAWAGHHMSNDLKGLCRNLYVRGTISLKSS